MKSRIFLVIFIAIFSGACKTKPENAVITRVPIPVVGTFAVLETPTKTVTPSVTTPPEYATFEAYKEATQEHIWAELESRGASCPEDYYMDQYYSVFSHHSTEYWTVFTCSPDDFSNFIDRFTTVVSTNLQTIWTITYEDFDWSDRQGAMLAPYRWTEDGKYVYLISETYPGGSGFYAPGFFLTERALYCLDLETGEFETILPEIGGYYAFSMSPNDHYLAYADPREENIARILDLKSGRENEIQLGEEYIRTGAFAWTLSSSHLIFAAAVDGWLEGYAGTSIFRLDISNQYLQLLIENNRRNFIPYYHYKLESFWIDDYILNLSAINVTDLVFEANSWSIDILNGKLSMQPTPTPRP